MDQTSGFSVKIFFPSGNPAGVGVIEKSNRLTIGVVFPRSLFAEVRKRSEIEGAGVYVLWESDGSSQLPRVYVGQAERLKSRLDNHARNKDFWTQGVFFTSKDRNLNKAHAQHLEARLIELSKKAARCSLDNKDTPQQPSLSEADRADAESYLSDILLCLPVLGVRYFETPPERTPNVKLFHLRSKGIQAKGYPGDGEFVVRKGSQAVKHETQSIHAHISDLRKMLVDWGILVDSGKTYTLNRDYVFSSPSSACNTLLGATASGPQQWKDAKGRSLKEIEDAKLKSG